jgi:hypothetical protein
MQAEITIYIAQQVRKDHQPVIAPMSVVVQRFQSLRRETRHSIKYPEIDILLLKEKNTPSIVAKILLDNLVANIPRWLYCLISQSILKKKACEL